MILDTSHGFNMIDIQSKPDCKDFTGIFEGLEGTHIVNPSKGQVKKLLKEHPERPLIICGHGDSTGVYNHMWNGYIITSKDVELLRKQQAIIGVWCYAGNFADAYNLKGFFTSMFISNTDEAMDILQTKYSEQEIVEENIWFSKKLNELIHSGIPMEQWFQILQDHSINSEKKFVKYNYEAMAYFNGK